MKDSIDLLPVSYRRSQLVQNSCLLWSTVLIVAAGFVGYEYHVECRAYRADLRTLRDQQRDYADVARQKRELPKLRKQLTAISEEERTEFLPSTADRTLSMLGVVSRSASECRGSLWIEELQLTTPPARDKRNGRLHLKGKALDNLAVATFVATLREAGVFDRVELKPFSQQRVDQRLRDYVVECQH